MRGELELKLDPKSTEGEGADLIASWKAKDLQYVNLDLDGKDERHRRHLYSFTRTRMANGIYVGMAQIMAQERWDGSVEKGKLDMSRMFPFAAKSTCSAAKLKAMDHLAQIYQPVRTHLVTSRDGINWDFGSLYAGMPFLTEAQCGFDLVASQIVTHNGFQHVYYECRQGKNLNSLRFVPMLTYESQAAMRNDGHHQLIFGLLDLCQTAWLAGSRPTKMHTRQQLLSRGRLSTRQGTSFW